MAMTPATLAQQVWAHWQSGQPMPHWAAADRPQSRDQGYAAQAELLACSGQAVAGWKIAATSAAGQAHIGVSGPLAGRVFAHPLREPARAVSLAGNRMRVAEPEMCFRMGQDLPPRPQAYSQAEVMAAVQALHIAIEVPNSRFADFVTAGEASLIADNACAHEFMLGPQAPDDWRTLDLAAHAVSARVSPANATAWTREGSGAAVLGDPRIALTWIANELRALGEGLRQGQFVTTGTCMPPLQIQPGDRVEVDFGRLGRMQAHFTD